METETVTVAELDKLESECGLGYNGVATVGCDWLQRIAAMLRALRPLVKEAECKRRITAAGVGWTVSSVHWGREECNGILLRDNNSGEEASFATWPEAAVWAEWEAAKQEPTLEDRLEELGAKVLKCTTGSGSVRWDVTFADGAARSWWPCDYSANELPMLERNMLSVAAAHRKPVERWSEPIGHMSCDRLREVLGMISDEDPPGGDSDMVTGWLCGYLKAVAVERGLLDEEGCRVRLPEVPV